MKVLLVLCYPSSLRMLVVGSLLLAKLATAEAQSVPEIQFIGAVSIPGDATDLSGDAALLENGEPRNRLGGFSALDYSGTADRFAALSDRGPDDGAVGYPCRVQMLDIRIQPGTIPAVSFSVAQTVMLRDGQHRNFVGSSATINATETTGHRLDPEGFRFGPDQTMYVSDEYGPTLLQFTADGTELRRFALPEYWLVATPNADKVKENRANTTGRASNRGVECLAMSADGKSLVGLMQGPLLQDGKRTEKDIVVGRNCRLVQIEIATGKLREYVYQLDSIDNGNSEILAYGANQYLVLERDSLAGQQAGYRKLILIDLSKATDILGTVTLSEELSEGIVPVERQAFLDLLDPQWNLAGESMPEKIEGLTFGPPLADGRKTLLIGTDNDFESANASQIWVFAVRP